MTTQWLTLQEYSNKYRVSISTLRRRIKSKEIEYIFKNGKYLILVSQKHLTDREHQKSFNDMQNLLKEKDFQISKLKLEIEDLNQLVLLLEQEKNRLEEIDRDADLKTNSLIDF